MKTVHAAQGPRAARALSTLVLDLELHPSSRPVFIIRLTLLERLTPTCLFYCVFLVEISLLSTSHYTIHLFNLLSHRWKEKYKFLSWFVFSDVAFFKWLCFASEDPGSPAHDHKGWGSAEKNHLKASATLLSQREKENRLRVSQVFPPPPHRTCPSDPRMGHFHLPLLLGSWYAWIFLRLFPQRKQLVNFSYPPSSGQCWYKHFLGI